MCKLRKVISVFLILCLIFCFKVGTLSAENGSKLSLDLTKDILYSTEFQNVIIELQDTPVIPYELKAKNNATLLSIKSNPDSFSYEKLLINEQIEAYNEIRKISDDAKIGSQFQWTLNGFELSIRGTDIKKLIQINSIKKVYSNVPLEAKETEATTSLNEGVDVNSIVGATEVWKLKDSKGNSIDGTGIVVAVIDTGVNYAHPDLGGSFGPNNKVIGGYDFGTDNPDPMDKSGHGTACAGIIAANGKVKGIAPNARILAYKCSIYEDIILTGALIASIEQSVKDGANVINLSISMRESELVSEALNNAIDAGIVIVNSMGNFGGGLFMKDDNGKENLFPATFEDFYSDKLATVGAYESENNNIAPYSSMGPIPDLTFKPDIIAPTNIHTTCLSETYTTLNGTSASTPVVTGCAILVKQAYPDRTAEEVKASLMNNATIEYNPINNEPITWLLQGAGLVNIYKAVTAPALITPYSFLIASDNLKPITFTIKNVSDTTQAFNISSELTLGNFAYGNVTDGISMSLSDNQITLNKDETKTVTATISVDKSKLEAGPYEGLIWFDNGSTKLHVPFIIWNAPKPEEWIAQLPKIFNVSSSSNLLNFSDPQNNKMNIDFTLGYGSRPIYPLTIINKVLFVPDIYRSNFVDEVDINLEDSNGTSIKTIYSVKNLLIGHYRFTWDPWKDLNDLLSTGLFNDGEYKLVVSSIDSNTVNGVTEKVEIPFEVKDVPRKPHLTVNIQNDLTITKYSTDADLSFTFTGKTDSGCSVTVNNNLIDVDNDGNFKIDIELSKVLNVIEVTSTNEAGLSTALSKNVYLKIVTEIKLTIGSKTFTVNSESKNLDSPPIIKNGRTLLPIRAIIEALGGTVEWNATDKKVTVSLGINTIELWIGKPQATVNGEVKWIDDTNHKVVPEIINGRTMLPLRFVAENLGAQVGWDGDTKTVTITYY